MTSTNERTLGLDSAQGVASASAIRALRERDVERPDELLAFNAPAAILAWCRWWDQQRGVRKELLVDRIRTGTLPPQRRTLDDQRAYGESIAAWIRAKLPDLCDERGRPHYAAIAAVIRLHYRHGKGSLTVRAHGAEIRAAVKAAKQDSGEG